MGLDCLPDTIVEGRLPWAAGNGRGAPESNLGTMIEPRTRSPPSPATRTSADLLPAGPAASPKGTWRAGALAAEFFDVAAPCSVVWFTVRATTAALVTKYRSKAVRMYVGRLVLAKSDRPRHGHPRCGHCRQDHGTVGTAQGSPTLKNTQHTDVGRQPWSAA
jgi:hypothetical protein